MKFGAKSSRREKTNDTDQWSYKSNKSNNPNFWGAGPTSLANFVTQNELDYPMGRIGAAIDPLLIRARVADLDRTAARLAVESSLSDFSMDENIDAAYVQGDLGFGPFQVMAGVRAEHTSFRAAGSKADPSGVISPLRAARSYTNWLPSLHGRYDLDRHTSIRAALSHAVVRANFSQLAPGVSLASSTEATIGNPDLDPLKARNLDLGIERIIGRAGSASVYLFHKDIKNFTYTTNVAGTGAWAGYTSAITYANGDTASVKGIELAYSQGLTMLPGPFKHLLLGANASLTDSRAHVARYDIAAKSYLGRTITLPGQSDRVMNLMLGYEHGPVSARLALNYKSPYLLELGADILKPSQDRIVDAQKQLDFSLAWQLSKQLQLVFDGANLNNEKYYVYQGDKKFNAQHEQYGRTYRINLKASAF